MTKSKKKKPTIEFEVLIEDRFANMCETELSPTELSLIDKKSVLSLINDFEEGKWKFQKFQSFLWDNITKAALTAEEREKLIDKNYTALVNAAKNLRISEKDKNKGSEIAEVCLYGIMHNHYNAESIVPKIFYKQNPQDNVKGADSVHIIIENDNDFSIWLGEAKFYNSIEEKRLSEIISSIKNLLSTDNLKKENSIITNLKEIDKLQIDTNLKNDIKLLLSGQTSIDKIKPKLHVPILLLYECDITKLTTQLSDDYKKEIIKKHKVLAKSYFIKQIKKLNSVKLYESIHFHLILFPIPEKEKIINDFFKQAKVYRI